MNGGLLESLKWTDKDWRTICKEWKGNFEVLEDGFGVPFDKSILCNLVILEKKA